MGPRPNGVGKALSGSPNPSLHDLRIHCPPSTRRFHTLRFRTVNQDPHSSSASATSGKFRVGIVGVSGYGGGEVLRLCATHPAFDLVYVAGEGSAGQNLG